MVSFSRFGRLLALYRHIESKSSFPEYRACLSQSDDIEQPDIDPAWIFRADQEKRLKLRN